MGNHLHDNNEKSLLSALLGTRASRESSRPHSVGPSNADEILNMNNPRPRAARTSKLEELSGDHGNLGKSKVTRKIQVSSCVLF